MRSLSHKIISWHNRIMSLWNKDQYLGLTFSTNSVNVVQNMATFNLHCSLPSYSLLKILPYFLMYNNQQGQQRSNLESETAQYLTPKVKQHSELRKIRFSTSHHMAASPLNSSHIPTTPWASRKVICATKKATTLLHLQETYLICTIAYSLYIHRDTWFSYLT